MMSLKPRQIWFRALHPTFWELEVTGEMPGTGVGSEGSRNQRRWQEEAHWPPKRPGAMVITMGVRGWGGQNPGGLDRV